MSKRIYKERDWSDTLCDRVHDVESSPSKDLWASIEQSLDSGAIIAPPTPLRHSHIWRWVGGAAATSAAAMLVAILSTDMPTTEELYSSISEVIEEEAEAEEMEPIEVESIEKKIERWDEVAMVTDRAEITPQEATPSIDNAPAEVTEEGESESPRERQSKQIEQRERVYPQDQSTPRSKHKTALSLSGSGGLIAASSSNPSRPVQASAYDVLLDRNDPYNNSSATHHQPFSFGIRVQHSLSPHIRLSSGANYTRLVSEIKYSAKSQMVDAKQQIHLIGVPLRLDYRFISVKDFSLYAGAGWAVEYCVGATLGGKSVGEKSWHYSTNVALGAEYSVNRWLGFYFEPEMGYYLTSTTLKSIRNDSPLTFTMRLGVSFTL